MRALILVAAIFALGAGASSAQWGSTSNSIKSDRDISLANYAAAERSTVAAWEKLPLTQRNVMFVDRKPETFGDYSPRSSNSFEVGEPLVTYAEPVGYTWMPRQNSYEFGVTVDFAVKSRDGKTLAQQKGFGKFVKTSHSKVQEFMMVLTLSIDGAGPGDYLLEYIIHDYGSTNVSSFEQPFTIRG